MIRPYSRKLTNKHKAIEELDNNNNNNNNNKDDDADHQKWKLQLKTHIRSVKWSAPGHFLKSQGKFFDT